MEARHLRRKKTKLNSDSVKSVNRVKSRWDVSKNVLGMLAWKYKLNFVQWHISINKYLTCRHAYKYMPSKVTHDEINCQSQVGAIIFGVIPDGNPSLMDVVLSNPELHWEDRRFSLWSILLVDDEITLQCNLTTSSLTPAAHLKLRSITHRIYA